MSIQRNKRPDSVHSEREVSELRTPRCAQDLQHISEPSADLCDYTHQFLQICQPLTTHAAKETQLEPGATRLGGSPDLPAGHAWPEHNGSLLPFVAQINLSKVAPYDTMHLLPTEGMLSFFFDIDAFFDSWPRQQSVWRVLYGHHAGALQQAPLPERGAKRKHYRPSLVTFSAEMTLPDYSQYDATSIQRLGLSGPLTQEEETADYEVQAQLANMVGTTSHIPLHSLLGHP